MTLNQQMAGEALQACCCHALSEHSPSSSKPSGLACCCACPLPEQPPPHSTPRLHHCTAAGVLHVRDAEHTARDSLEAAHTKQRLGGNLKQCGIDGQRHATHAHAAPALSKAAAMLEVHLLLLVHGVEQVFMAVRPSACCQTVSSLCLPGTATVKPLLGRPPSPVMAPPAAASAAAAA